MPFQLGDAVIYWMVAEDGRIGADLARFVGEVIRIDYAPDDADDLVVVRYRDGATCGPFPVSAYLPYREGGE